MEDVYSSFDLSTSQWAFTGDVDNPTLAEKIKIEGVDIEQVFGEFAPNSVPTFSSHLY